MSFEFQEMKNALDLASHEEIKTKHDSCPHCGGKIVLFERSLEKGFITLYTESGPKKVKHLEYRCTEHHCKSGLFHGYSIKKGGSKIYDNDCLQQKYLVVSRKTAFSIPMLYSTTLKVYHHNGTFDCLASEYNDFQNFGE